MRSIYILLVLISINAVAQDINIPDPIFKSKLIAAGVDTSGDGIIQEAEALAVTELVVNTVPLSNPNKITNMEGIQFFTNLTTLKCSGNQLTSLDVTMLSELEVLYCYSSGLTSLNVTGLSHLEYLWCQGNPLGNLNLSGLPAMLFLWCADTGISTLDVTGMPVLRTLNCSDNQLQDIDLTSNIQMIDLYCDNNQFTGLQVNHISTMQILECRGNQIAAIDLSGMMQLLYLRIDDNLLEVLDCSQTGAQMIHCTNNPNLQAINARNGVVSWSDPDLLYFGFLFDNLPSLEIICMDAGEEFALSHSNYNDLGQNAAVVTNDNCELSSHTLDSAGFTVYPNPVSNFLEIESSLEIQAIELFDSSGRRIARVAMTNDLNEIIPGLSKGIYVLKVFGDNVRQSVKLVKN